MKAYIKYLSVLAFLGLISCGQSSTKEESETHQATDELNRTEETKAENEVISFNGVQVTGVTVSDNGRIFANFPRWRENVPYSVVEVNSEEGGYQSYPNLGMNNYNPNSEDLDGIFMCVQSVLAHDGKLYILDTRNPMFKGVKDAPRVFVVDLSTNKLDKVLKLTEGSYKQNSYVNDLRVDDKNGKIYFTDSGESGLIVMDLATGESKRVLDDHPSTAAEVDHLVVDGKKWENTVHSDGIALDLKNDKLYYHALSGYTLYAIPTEALISSDNPEKEVIEVKKTAAPDGMILDDKGNLYFADLENNKINYLTPDGEIKTLTEGEDVSWADTFSIYNGELYYTNSKIHLAGGDVSDLNFPILKVSLP
ncbi:hypothetical protein E1176_09310 [Fulvivirga sp. RKSG066]|uniref:L-dopachrome tautomerase-related protein n=1 Tax=Fulvivirga aurantia TaxID=2529383 RepID=UPI0012BD2FD4|nr:L-dopachrome tautomerase-related protein [Fulvivirga aurantia]MTI21216.1 hypothetical protein [Fulvivirga aurantia]